MGCLIYPEGVRVSKREPIESHTYVFSKKKIQVSSPGRAPPARKWLKRGRGKFSSPKNSPPLIQKMKAHGISWFSPLSLQLYAFHFQCNKVRNKEYISTFTAQRMLIGKERTKEYIPLLVCHPPPPPSL